jgi:hypothetical protein
MKMAPDTIHEPGSIIAIADAPLRDVDVGLGFHNRIL